VAEPFSRAPTHGGVALSTPESGADVVVDPGPPLDAGTHYSMLLRSLAVQGSWNYESLVGNGVGFCVEPALRRLPGGVTGEAYRSALARQCAYFNAHPYLATLAIGALARAELDHVLPARIERFRTALCGPLGSVGDRLVWASWLPACSLLALLLFGVGWSPVWVLGGFLAVYNVGHIGLREWGLRQGWRHGLRLASALAHPVLQHGPRYIGRVAAVLGGLALPLAVHRAIGGGPVLAKIPVVVAVMTPLLAVVLVRVHGRTEGWRLVLLLLAILTLYSVIG